MPDFLKPIDWLMKNYTFTGPLIVLVCYQILKFVTGRLEQQTEIAYSAVTTLGAELNIICIPILLSNWQNQTTLLYKEFGKTSLALGITLLLLIVSASISIWLIHKLNTDSESNRFANWLCAFCSSDRQQLLVNFICSWFRRLIYFSISFGIGLCWMLTLYKYK